MTRLFSGFELARHSLRAIAHTMTQALERPLPREVLGYVFPARA